MLMSLMNAEYVTGLYGLESASAEVASCQNWSSGMACSRICKCNGRPEKPGADAQLNAPVRQDESKTPGHLISEKRACILMIEMEKQFEAPEEAWA